MDQKCYNIGHFGGNWRNPNRDCIPQNEISVKFLGCDNTV